MRQFVAHIKAFCKVTGRLSAGVTNLFNKKITRRSNNSATAGAMTYNEPGRGFYVSFNSSF